MDLIAGLTVLALLIPEGMAYASLVGVNPVYGLYAGMVPTIAAALSTGTILMISTLTSAIALTTAMDATGNTNRETIERNQYIPPMCEVFSSPSTRLISSFWKAALTTPTSIAASQPIPCIDATFTTTASASIE